jgi:ABC-type Zn uptake system ZnuABC Zn-binding protein ZnuA
MAGGQMSGYILRRVAAWVGFLLACGAAQAAAGQTPSGVYLPPPVFRNANGSPMLRVVATTTQIADLTRNVGGNLAHVDAILSANMDPRDFQLGPGELQRLAWADLILTNGLGLEDAWLGPLRRGNRIPVEVTRKGFRRLPGSSGVSAPTSATLETDIAVVSRGVRVLAADGAESGQDPQIWLAVPNAVRMVANICDAMAAAAPPYAGEYRANAARYIAQLRALDSDISSRIGALPLPQRTVAAGRDMFRYYGARYGLTLVPVGLPRIGQTASAREIAALVATIRAHHAKAVLADSSVDVAVAEQVGREAGARVITDLYGAALGLPGSDGETYLKMMRHNTDVIVSALR